LFCFSCFLLYSVLQKEDCLNEDDQVYSLDKAPEIPEPSPPRPASAPLTGVRQRAIAYALPLSMTNIVQDIAGRDPLKVVQGDFQGDARQLLLKLNNIIINK